MEGFYSDEKNKIVKPELFDKTAQEIANTFVGKDKFGKYYGVSGTQMRRLYDEVKRFENNLDGTPDSWKKNYPYIRMIKSKVAYNVARAIEKNRFEADVYNNLSSFIMKWIEYIKDEEDYHVFTALFEAVYGFYYEKNPERKSKRGN